MSLLRELYRRGWLSAVVIAAAFGYLLPMSWMRWGDLVVDLGRECYVPARLAAGEVLYRDMFYLYGPFSPYFNALLFKISGTHLHSLVFGGILVTGLVCLLLFKLSRAFMNVFFATFTVLVFLFVLAFGNFVYFGNYNFILPYSYPATHSVLLALGAFWFLFRYMDREKMSLAYGAGGALFLCLITRLEIGVMLAVVMAGSAFFLRLKPGGRSLWGPLVLYPAAAALAVYVVFFLLAGDRLLQSNLGTLFTSNLLTTSPFARALSGADAAGGNLALMFRSLGGHVLLAVCFAGVGYLMGGLGVKVGDTYHIQRANWVHVPVLLLAGGGAAIFSKMFFGIEAQYLCAPLIFLLAAGFSFARYFRSGRQASDLKLGLLAIFSFLMIMRILLGVHAWHYGFYLLVPGLVVYHAALFNILPRLTDDRRVTLALYGGFTLVLCVLMAGYFNMTRQVYAKKTLKVISPAGALAAFDDERTRGVDAIVRYLLENTPKDATVAVFPEGVMINFLAQRRTPLYYHSFLPQDLSRDGVEAGIVAELVRTRTDYVVILQRSVAEYGSRGFGADYGLKIIENISRTYTPAAQVGPLPFNADHFSAVILKRN